MSDKWDYLPPEVRAAVLECEAHLAAIDAKFGQPATTNFDTATQAINDRPWLRDVESIVSYRRRWMNEREPWISMIGRLTASYVRPIFLTNAGTLPEQKV
jgi:hypothetical protein